MRHKALRRQRLLRHLWVGLRRLGHRLLPLLRLRPRFKPRWPPLRVSNLTLPRLGLECWERFPRLVQLLLLFRLPLSLHKLAVGSRRLMTWLILPIRISTNRS